MICKINRLTTTITQSRNYQQISDKVAILKAQEQSISKLNHNDQFLNHTQPNKQFFYQKKEQRITARYAYVWQLSPGISSAQYAMGIRASVTILKKHNAEELYTVNNCEFTQIPVHYILLRPVVQDDKFNAVVAEINFLFDHIVAMPSTLGAKGYHYADNYAKLFLLGFYDGGPFNLQYNRVMYLEADYLPMRSLTHLFVFEPSQNSLHSGPNPEWEFVTKTDKTNLLVEIEKANYFVKGAQNCAGLWKHQVINADELRQQQIVDQAGFIAMPTAYWVKQPCYTSGGPILFTPSQFLYMTYTIPLTHCEQKNQIYFAPAQICNHPLSFKGICQETDMGYLNRIVLQHNRSLERTLHPFYTVLKNEFVYQPEPNSNMKGYWTRNYFENNETRTFENLFGVHFAGPIKAWHSPPHHNFGRPMTELSKLVQHFHTMGNFQSAEIFNLYTFDCSDLSNVRNVVKIGNGITKTAYQIQIQNEKLIAKRVSAESPDKRTRMGVYKLLKEAHILNTIQAENPTSLRVKGICISSEDASMDDFQHGVTTLYEFQAKHETLPLNYEPWIVFLKKLYRSSLGSIIITDIKKDQFMVIRGQINMHDMDDVFIEAVNKIKGVQSNCNQIVSKLRVQIDVQKCVDLVTKQADLKIK